MKSWPWKMQTSSRHLGSAKPWIWRRLFLATPKINWCFTTKKIQKHCLRDSRKTLAMLGKIWKFALTHQMLMVCSMVFFPRLFPCQTTRGPSENSGARPRHFQASWGSRWWLFRMETGKHCAPPKKKWGKILENRWKLWIYVNLCESMWIYVNLCESMWIYVNLCESMWIWQFPRLIVNFAFARLKILDKRTKKHTHSAGSQAIVLGKWSNPYGILNKLIWAVYLMSMGFSGS